ncbi:MAG: hypothetical protein LBP39_01545 [Rickettsiales bacterium]|jgi:hypothetical protein|nr:hypothetical protein [Rickettsiales bacterium]
MKILIFSDDVFLTSAIRTKFSSNLSISVFEENKDQGICDCQILVFDCKSAEFVNAMLAGLCLNNRLVISIGNVPISSITVIPMPFRIGNLFAKISNFIYYSKNNINTLAFGTVNFNENTLVKDNTVVQFTEREMELIKKIVAVHRISRDGLLKDVWNTTIEDNRVVETAVHNIKQKLIAVGLDDFIEYSGGYYQIKNLN